MNPSLAIHGKPFTPQEATLPAGCAGRGSPFGETARAITALANGLHSVPSGSDWLRNQLWRGGQAQGMSFALGLNERPTASNAPGQTGAGTAWTLWGESDLQRHDSSDAEGRFDGGLDSTWLGVDAAFGERWLAGLALSRGRGHTDYATEAVTGVMHSELLTLTPYLRGELSERLSLWGFLGVGRGDLHNSRSASRSLAGAGFSNIGLASAPSALPDSSLAGPELIRERGTLSLRMASLGLRHESGSLGPVRLSLLGDFGTAILAVGSGEGALADLGASTSRARLGIEGSFVHGGLSGTLRLSGRADGGGGITGSGIELATGLRYATGRFEGGVSGRWLVAHSAASYNERSLAANLDWHAHQDGSGLTFSFAPSWGHPGSIGMGGIASMGAMAGAAGMNGIASPGAMIGADATGSPGNALWGEERMRSLSATSRGAARANTLSFETRIGYGLIGPAGQRLQPSAVWRDSTASREAGLGLEYDGVWTMRMEMTHRASALEPGRWGVQLGIVKPL